MYLILDVYKYIQYSISYLNRKISTKVLQQMSQPMLQQLELVSTPCSGSRCAMCRMQVVRVFFAKIILAKIYIINL